MSLQTRLGALITAIGADIKDHATRLTTLEGKPNPFPAGKKVARGTVTITWAGGSSTSGNVDITLTGATGTCQAVVVASTVGLYYVIMRVTNAAGKVTISGITHNGGNPAAASTASVDYIIWEV